MHAAPLAAAVVWPGVLALAGCDRGVPKVCGMLCGHTWDSPALLWRSWWSKTHFKGQLKLLGSALQEFQELLFMGKGQAGLCFLAKVA